MNRALSYLGLAGLGIAGIYLLDPAKGPRRRANMRDKLVHGATRSSDSVAAAAGDMARRMEALLIEARSRVSRRSGKPASLHRSEHENIAARQRGTTHAQPAREPGNWSPALRLAAGGAGLALLGYCMARRDRSTTWLGFIGAGLLMRATTNMEWGRLAEIAAGGGMEPESTAFNTIKSASI